MKIPFNQIYIIESLRDGDVLTGTNLHNDLLQYQTFKHPDFTSILKSPKDLKEWDELFSEIKEDCIKNHNCPILHFEVHGSSDKNGLVLNSGELVTWKHLYYNITPINEILNNKLFITLAVCHGNFFMSKCRIDQHAPFRGIIGSFDSIYESDLVIRYYEFYEELFNSLDINKAFEKMKKANPNRENSFFNFSADYIFAHVFLDYLKEDCTTEAFKKRAEEIICANGYVFLNRQDKRFRIRAKVKELENSIVPEFKTSYRNYFMLDLDPNLAEEIEYKDNIHDMEKWYNNLK